ncbi:hypothetical protein [Methylobacterium sp. Leaf100]|uniref:hypothetical protein n=1 Tax=Methylobacterium sp. Leaf100 TaxID=1736252 RepID=UPI000B0594BC|nr:hypothetical protein [Methylobacterium sp. Leaf100]
MGKGEIGEIIEKSFEDPQRRGESTARDEKRTPFALKSIRKDFADAIAINADDRQPLTRRHADDTLNERTYVNLRPCRSRRI